MKTLALSLLLAASARAQTGVPVLANGAPDAAAAAEVQAMLDGRSVCRAAEVRALYDALETYPGRGDGASAKGLFTSWCERKLGALYYKAKGAIAQDVLSDSSAVWLDGKGGVVKNSELSERLEALTDERRRALRANPAGAPKMAWEFTLTTDAPGAWRSSWQSAGGSRRLVVNQGDTVTLNLVNNIYSSLDYANLTIQGYGVSADVAHMPTGAAFRLTFVADKAGTFPFFDARSQNRIPGELVVLPR